MVIIPDKKLFIKSTIVQLTISLTIIIAFTLRMVKFALSIPDKQGTLSRREEWLV